MCVGGGGGGANLRVLQRGADFEAKIRGVNSVSGENLHDFEIISRTRGVRTHPTPPPILCVRACI